MKKKLIFFSLITLICLYLNAMEDKTVEHAKPKISFFAHIYKNTLGKFFALFKKTKHIPDDYTDEIEQMLDDEPSSFEEEEIAIKLAFTKTSES